MTLSRLLKVITVLIFITGMVFISIGCDSSGGTDPDNGNNPGGGGTAPASPSNVRVTPADAQLTVSWDIVSNASKYTVYYGTAANYESANKHENITEASKVITGLLNGTTYNIWVQAHNSAGSSAVSTAKTGTPVAAITAPASPTGVAVTAGDAGEINVSWSTVTGATGYKVYYHTADNFASATGTDAGTSLNKTITGLADGTVYYIWVTASNAAGESAPSAVQSRSTIMPVPQGVTVTGGVKRITVSWNAVTGAASYDIYYSTSPTPPGSPNVTGITGTTATITGLIYGTTYYAWVRAKSTSGAESSLSSMASGVTIQFNMVSVTGGTFKLGASDPDMTVSSFIMAETEVTQGLWEAVMGINPSYFQGATHLPESTEIQEKRPVEQVSWYDAIAFCNKLSILDGKTPVYIVSGVDFNTLAYGDIPVADDPVWNAATVNWAANGYRLPTEMEWMWAVIGAVASINGYKKEYAGDDNPEAGGGLIGDYAWYDVNSGSKTHEVKKRTANELGLYDMSGNVYEWCWDWYDTYPGTAQTDYSGPGSSPESGRVIRGGDWNFDASGCAVAYRVSNTPNSRYDFIGFRFLRTE